MAKGLYLMPDGRVLVEYGARRVPISLAQYKANGYRPPCDNLPAEIPLKARKNLAHAETLKAGGAPPTMRSFVRGSVLALIGAVVISATFASLTDSRPVRTATSRPSSAAAALEAAAAISHSAHSGG